MNREDVEALLAACERDRIGPHPSNETLAALCRRWLEVEDAPKAVVECNDAKGAWLIAADDAPLSGGQRVRIVPEAGQGGGDYWGAKPQGGEADWTGYDG